MGRVTAPEGHARTVSVVPGLGLHSRIVIVPWPGPDGTGVDGDGCAVAGGAEGAVGVIPLVPLHAVRTARRNSALVTCDTFCMEHSKKCVQREPVHVGVGWRRPRARMPDIKRKLKQRTSGRQATGR